MKHVVGVSDMKLSTEHEDLIITHALGSCIGIAIHDSKVGVGGMLHYMLPLSKLDEEKAEENPCMFGDTGIPHLFKQAYTLGASKENIRVVMAGGANLFGKNDMFVIGKRNETIARKMFWKNNIIIDKEHIGGDISRTLCLEIGSGKTWIVSNGVRIDL